MLRGMILSALLGSALSCSFVVSNCAETDFGCNPVLAGLLYSIPPKPRPILLATSQTGDISMARENLHSWTTTRPAGVVLWDSAFGNGWFCVVGATATALRSNDGVTWEASTVPSAVDIKAITFQAGRFITATGDGTGPGIGVSTDCFNWTFVSAGSGGQFEGIAANGSAIMGCGGDGTIVCKYSSDGGVQWQDVTPAGITHTKRGAFLGGSFYFTSLSAGGKLARTTNGVDWEIITVPGASTAAYLGLTAAEGRLMLASFSGDVGYWMGNSSVWARYPAPANLFDIQYHYGSIFASAGNGLLYGKPGSGLEYMLQDGLSYLSLRSFQLAD